MYTKPRSQLPGGVDILMGMIQGFIDLVIKTEKMESGKGAVYVCSCSTWKDFRYI